MYSKHYNYSFILFSLMFKFSMLHCVSAAFDCKEHNGRTVDGIRLLVNCTLTVITDIDDGWTIGWKKDHGHIGHCYTYPVRCHPYNLYGERFYILGKLWSDVFHVRDHTADVIGL